MTWNKQKPKFIVLPFAECANGQLNHMIEAAVYCIVPIVPLEPDLSATPKSRQGVGSRDRVCSRFHLLPTSQKHDPHHHGKPMN